MRTLSMPRGRLFYHCYDHDDPSGGQKSTYQHVDALNGAGLDAAVVHTSRDNRVTWFENNTRVVTWDAVWNTFDANHDYLVLPEDLGSHIANYPGRKIIFNKGLHRGFKAICSGEIDPYLLPDVLAVLSVSEHNREHLQFNYPHLPIIRVVEHIDSDIFAFTPASMKRKQIACSTKSPMRGMSVRHMFMSRARAGLNRGSEYNWVYLEGKTERQVAEILGESMMFVYCSSEEGLGRAPLEAILCGCLPIAFRVGPLREYLPSYLPSDVGDLISLVSIMESFINSEEPGSAFKEVIEDGRRDAKQFSLPRHLASVCNAWATILKLPL